MSASSAIRQRLKDIGMSQTQLAEALGTNKQNLGNKLRRDNFSARELFDICQVVGLHLAMIETVPEKYTIEYTLNEV